MHGINIFFIDQVPIYLVLKKVHFMLAYIFKSFHLVTILKNDKEKFLTALRKYLHTHCFYSVDAFFMCKDDLLYFYKMFIVCYTKFVYLCIYDLSL